MLKFLASTLNTVLHCDELISEKLQPLDGRLLKVVLMPFNIAFYMQFHEDKIALLSDTEQAPDTVIYSSPISLLRLGLLPAANVRSLFQKDIRMEGDPLFGQAVKRFFDEIDLDWEGQLANFIGDVLAYQVGQGVRGIKRFTMDVAVSWQRNLSDYVHEEGRVSPSQEALRDFCEDVDALALDVERLEAKIQLEQEL